MQSDPTNNIIMVYMTTTVNHEEINNNPPLLPFLIEDLEHKKLLLDNARHGADQYDMYKNIVQLSFLCKNVGHKLNNNFVHFMFCESLDRLSITDTEGCKIFVYNDKVDMATGIVTTLNMLGGKNPDTGYPDGSIPVMAGWKINTDIWPFLVNMALASHQRLPDWWMTDLLSRWNTVKGMLDVSNIYSQNVSMSMRRLPALGDALRYWGVGTEFDEPINIVKAVCDNPQSVVAKIEPYLTGMYTIVRRYYGHDNYIGVQ